MWQRTGLVQERFAHTVAWLLRVQAMLSVIGALIFGLLVSVEQGLAVLVGGGIGVMLTAVSALRAGAGSSSAEPSRMMAAFYRAMALKLVLAAVLFIVVAKWFAGYFVPILTGYVATVLAYWIALLRLGRTA
ncbi:MAG: hypothetical protein HND55_15355 [Pseudomonadota bacterium]|nr:MAG: hypothetical protein HND55_00020 [Pseudomonadota bacterium]QKK03908.1 MAG: hypothetical protein HND55_15355 [Pseudomonadota bacterium]